MYTKRVTDVYALSGVNLDFCSRHSTLTVIELLRLAALNRPCSCLKRSICCLKKNEST